MLRMMTLQTEGEAGMEPRRNDSIAIAAWSEMHLTTGCSGHSVDECTAGLEVRALYYLQRAVRIS